ncbi:hypothetical protein [Rhodococcus sp. A5(2022)]|uniref:hypothetical protein n=1 Tax=Rhodococcus sp. A5(2022) TaxID=3003588 RepID=UPI0022A87A56|nr:hypothetical protein [Rhodococcus sp. A5(2022)]MCZ1070811.1 hypothetical protein [Rhodococcus sp. A5(2022)]
MSSPSVALGSQNPRVALAPKSASSDAPDAVFLASSYGLVPDEWQETVLEGWLGLRADGRWSAARCGLAVPRQNGKNGVLEVRELFGMVARGEKFLHTAHEVKTARKAFLRLASFFENERQYPELAALVKEVRRTNGQEAIVLTNGGSCEFIARSKGSGRGFTVDVLVMDEAQELSDDALAALLPTISASPSGNPQTIMTGTPPSEGMDGEVFTRTRTAGVEGKDRRLCWFEWSCEGTVDMDAPDVWALANPALGSRLNFETVADERAAMDDETFGRERLGMWSTSKVQRVISADSWRVVANAQILDSGGEVALAVDTSPDQNRTTISGAGWTADGLKYIDAAVRTRDGAPDWAVGEIVGMCERSTVRAVVIDGASPASSLIDKLRERGVTVTVTNARQMGHACAWLYSDVMDGKLQHLDQPALNAALAGAGKRTIGDGLWGWNRKTAESDITPLVSATLAAWGLTSTEIEKPKRRRTGKATFA